MRNDTDEIVTLLGMGNRTLYPARGIMGGGDGTLREHQHKGKAVHAKGRIEVAPGDMVRIIEAGGGGYGDPKQRDRNAVADDVANGLVSREAASRDYGWTD